MFVQCHLPIRKRFSFLSFFIYSKKEDIGKTEFILKVKLPYLSGLPAQPPRTAAINTQRPYREQQLLGGCGPRSWGGGGPGEGTRSRTQKSLIGMERWSLTQQHTVTGNQTDEEQEDI